MKLPSPWWFSSSVSWALRVRCVREVKRLSSAEDMKAVPVIFLTSGGYPGYQRFSAPAQAYLRGTGVLHGFECESPDEIEWSRLTALRQASSDGGMERVMDVRSDGLVHLPHPIEIENGQHVHLTVKMRGDIAHFSGDFQLTHAPHVVALMCENTVVDLGCLNYWKEVDLRLAAQRSPGGSAVQSPGQL